MAFCPPPGQLRLDASHRDLERLGELLDHLASKDLQRLDRSFRAWWITRAGHVDVDVTAACLFITAQSRHGLARAADEISGCVWRALELELVAADAVPEHDPQAERKCELVKIATAVRTFGAQAGCAGRVLVRRDVRRMPSVAKRRSASQGDLAGASDPDRDRAHGTWREVKSGEPIPPALERGLLPRPDQPEDLDVLV